MNFLNFWVSFLERSILLNDFIYFIQINFLYWIKNVREHIYVKAFNVKQYRYFWILHVNN